MDVVLPGPPLLRAEVKLSVLRAARGDEPFLITEESLMEEFDAAELTNEEIWALGVSWHRWHPEEPPTDMTRESMSYRFYVDTRYRRYDDRIWQFEYLGYSEDE